MKFHRVSLIFIRVHWTSLILFLPIFPILLIPPISLNPHNIQASKHPSIQPPVASAGDAKRKQSAALIAPGVSNKSCGSSCRRPDMLVMSLSPLLGQAIPESAETAEIVVSPRRGSRSGGLGVPKPHEENQSRYPPRIFLGARGGLRGVTGARVWRTFASDRRSAIAVCVLFVHFRPNLNNFLNFSVFVGSLEAFQALLLTIFYRFSTDFRNFRGRVTIIDIAASKLYASQCEHVESYANLPAVATFARNYAMCVATASAAVCAQHIESAARCARQACWLTCRKILPGA